MATRKPRTRTLQEFQHPIVEDPDQDHEPTSDVDPLQTPVVASVILQCPKCGQAASVAAKLQTRLVQDQDGTGHLALRVRSPKAGHLCGQTTLGLVEGPRER